MKNGSARFDLIVLLAAVLLLVPALRSQAQANASPEDAKLAAQDKDGCIRNLKIIYDAIQAYRLDHKDIPNWLSDLVPQYITDANVLICPACKRTGQAETGALADPKIPSSYYYEFCPVVLGAKELPNLPGKTRRELKRRQMGLVGPVVPLVRCKHHDSVLNLSFDGKIYESQEDWKILFTNQVNIGELSAPRLFADSSPANATPKGLYFLQRSHDAKLNQINLTDFYNAVLNKSWHDTRNNDLGSLPTGLQKFAGVEFDVRGVVQLSSKSDSAKRFPVQVRSIPVGLTCKRLHFLHAAAFAKPPDEGVQVASYVIHYASNNQSEIPIVCGRDVRDWHSMAREKLAPELTVAWTGTNEVSKSAGQSIRLFKTTWENTAPSVEIESIDIVSSMNTPALFVVAITAE